MATVTSSDRCDDCPGDVSEVRSQDVSDEAGREWGGVGGSTMAVDGADSEDATDIDEKDGALSIGFRDEMGVLHSGLLPT